MRRRRRRRKRSPWRREFKWLGAYRPAGFAWMTQDLHPSGAVGDATLATAGEGRSGARARRASLRRTAPRDRPLRSGAPARRAARLTTFLPHAKWGRGTARLRGGRGAGLDALSATTTKRQSQTPPPPCFAWSPSPASRGRMTSIRSRGASSRPSFACKLLRTTSPKKGGMERREAPKSWPRHAGECCHSLALRARRAPQDDPLARTACFGRAAPPGAPPRFLA